VRNVQQELGARGSITLCMLSLLRLLCVTWRVQALRMVPLSVTLCLLSQLWLLLLWQLLLLPTTAMHLLGQLLLQ